MTGSPRIVALAPSPTSKRHKILGQFIIFNPSREEEAMLASWPLKAGRIFSWEGARRNNKTINTFQQAVSRKHVQQVTFTLL